MSDHTDQPAKRENAFAVNRILEFHLADHCNLSCKYCAHYAPVAEPRYATTDEIIEAMRAVQIISPRTFKILGGEPLLHPHIDEVLNCIGERLPEGITALLTTNGILLKEMSDEFWEVIKKHDITIYISVYPKKIDYQGMISLARSKGVTPKGIRFPALRFSKVLLAEDKRYDPAYAYSSCRAKCMQIRDGRLYPCPYSAYIEHINRRFDTAFVHNERDYLNLNEISDGRIVEQWMREPKPFCACCNYGHESRLRWESTGSHSADEWVEGPDE